MDCPGIREILAHRVYLDLWGSWAKKASQEKTCSDRLVFSDTLEDLERREVEENADPPEMQD